MRSARNIAVALLLAAVACSSEKEPIKQSKVSQLPSGRGGQTKGPRTGGYLILPSAEPAILNPVLQNAFDLVHPFVFEGLVALDATGELVPRLAETWERSPDQKTLTFRLRKNVTWHDSRPFTAADVLFTVDTIRASQSPWAGYLEPVEKIEAPDDHTVVVTLKQAFGPDVACFTFGLIPKHVYDGKDLEKADANRAPIGTGPFRFTRWTPGKSIILEANPTHWFGRPYIDQIELVFEGSIPPSDYLGALQSSKLDFAPIYETKDWAGLFTPEFREQFEIGTIDEPVFTLIAWNNNRKPFDDRRVRVALAHALDRQRVIEDVMQGSARQVSAPFYPTMWGGDPSIPPWPFDPARAVQLLDEAGFAAKEKSGQRFTFELLISESNRGPALDQTLAIFRHDLSTIGVEMKTSWLPRNQLVGRLILRDFDAALYQWGADIPDPDPFVLLHSSQVGAGNYAGYSNADVDRLVAEGRSTTDRAKRKAAYSQLHKLVHEAEPYTILHARQDHFAWNRRLKGVNPIDVGALPRWPGVARWWVGE